MGNYQHFYRGEHKQPPSDRVAVHSNGSTHVVDDGKRHHKMAQVKLLWLLLDFIGVPVTLLGILTNIDNVKSLILALLGATYVVARIWFFIARSKQTLREKEYELWHKSIDKFERESRFNKKNGK